jgi:hypothetical protein
MLQVPPRRPLPFGDAEVVGAVDRIAGGLDGRCGGPEASHIRAIAGDWLRRRLAWFAERTGALYDIQFVAASSADATTLAGILATWQWST